MADADQQETSSQTQPDLSGIKTELDSKLAEVQAQLKAMNEQFAQSLTTVVEAVKPKPKEQTIEDDDIYDPKRLTQKVLSKTDEVVSRALAKERQMNAKIYELSQEFPEITASADVRKAVLEAHNSLPEGMRDTAEGYEVAVYKAVAKQGLIPKSKRQIVDEDISVGSGRSTSSPKRESGNKKVSEKTIAVAELLRGRSLTKEELKGLEEAAQRDSWGRYR